MFLESKYEALVRTLTHKMKESVRLKEFEEAAKVRDQINALSVFGQGKIHVAGLNELGDLKALLRLDKLPERVEAFDISNISGKEATGSMVSFYKGVPDKNNYRRFRIRLHNKIDDYAMLREVVGRRYLRLTQEHLALPDLVLIDGGKAHLLAAKDEIEKLGLKIPLMSIAKEKEHIYVADRSFPLKLDSDTPALNLIRRIRDEAHRFAVAYHHILRRKKIIGK
jgi:excinuclease ABC subunit C